MNDDYESDQIPLQHQRAFGGAGIKRKRIDFVPASISVSVSQPHASNSAPKASLQDLYLSIVLPKNSTTTTLTKTEAQLSNKKEQHNAPLTSADTVPSLLLPPPSSKDALASTCPICQIPLSQDVHNVHESTLSHQLSLPHTHPPSHINRRSKGLAYLHSYGWDPDARVGLGAVGEGRLFPVRAGGRENQDKRGIGAESKDVVAGVSGGKHVHVHVNRNGRERKMAEEGDKAREKKMRDLFYGREDVNSYLGIKL